jgi:multidrug efflux pump subunit AcrA (membrane-fusion protein)
MDPRRTSALQAAQSPAITRSILVGSLVFLIVLGVLLAFVPWRQTVSGSGEVMAYAPEARPRPVEARLSARVGEWYVVEGEQVAKGDTIAVLQDLGSSYLDDQFADRVVEQRASKLEGLRLEVEQARQKLAQARQKRRAADEKVSNAALGISTARTRLSRVEDLQDDGISSVRDLETDLEREGEFLRLRLRASGFPRQLVRRVVSLVAELGRGVTPEDRLERVLSPEPLSGPEAVPPAPAEALVLTDVSYPLSFEGNDRVLSEAREWFEARRVEGATLARVSATIGSSLPE